jgi:hypothetical protein
VFCLLRSRWLAVLLWITIAAGPVVAGDGSGVAHAQKTPSYILIGFVGGFVRHDNPHHGPVQVAERLQRELPSGAYVQIFENRHTKNAYRTILRLLDHDADGTLSPQEKAGAHIILFGQSWGGSAVVQLARDLHRAGVPVLLTVQVDSVRKLWQNDKLIPANVAEAVNFYQTHGLIHGQRQIQAADPSRTEILGNYRFDYRQNPVHCDSELSWYDRFFTPGHAQSECDPHLWAEVEDLMRGRIEQ